MTRKRPPSQELSTCQLTSVARLSQWASTFVCSTFAVMQRVVRVRQRQLTLVFLRLWSLLVDNHTVCDPTRRQTFLPSHSLWPVFNSHLTKDRRLSWSEWFVTYQDGIPWTVSHLDTNRAPRINITALMRTTPLPLRQTATHIDSVLIRRLVCSLLYSIMFCLERNANNVHLWFLLILKMLKIRHGSRTSNAQRQTHQEW